MAGKRTSAIMISFVFENGHLCVARGGERLRFWPDGRLVREGRAAGPPPDTTFRLLAPAPVCDDPGRAMEPRHADIHTMLSPAAVAEKHRAYAGFRAALPAAVAAAVEPFRAGQWNLICLLRQSPAALDLAHSSPALAFALANQDAFRDRQPAWADVVRRAAYLVSRRQRDILKWLGFPDTEAAARVFRRLPPQAVHTGGLRLLRNVLGRAPASRWLAHLRRPNAGVLAAIGRAALHPLLSPVLLEDIAGRAEDDYFAPSADLLLDVAGLWEELYPSRPPPRPATVNAARLLHDRLVLERPRILEARQAQREQQIERDRIRLEALRPPRDPDLLLGPAAAVTYRTTGTFPPPPLPGNEHIRPITTQEELNCEGIELRNCVGSYGPRVLRGGIYLYSVHVPQRATLSLVRCDGRWVIEQLRVHANRAPRGETTRAVIDWLWQARYAAAKG